MKIITCASYYGSGSSAVTDLVAEYSNVKKMGDYEFRILHDIDGVSDLEFHLTECHNRHNSGHALKRFLKLAKFYKGNFLSKGRYEPFFKNKFYETTLNYINELTDLKYNAWWFYDLYDRGNFYYYYKQIQNHIMRRLGFKKTILRREITYCSHPSKEKFLTLTQEYTHKLFELANSEGKDYLEIDQIVPSQNIDRIMRYFKDDVYVIVVDRDPRDIYLTERLKWREHVIPWDVADFCRWYKYTRQSGSITNSNSHIIYVHFEDLIYNYFDEVKKIENHLGLNSDSHIQKFSFFNPKVSFNNTQIWKKNDSFTNEIRIIEEELKEYLYDFEKCKDNTIAGIDKKNNGIF